MTNKPISIDRSATRPSAGRLIAISLLSWLAMVGFDFFLHAGLLAKLYQEPSPFLLAPAEAFRRIPLGYLAFLILAITQCWLMLRLQIAGWRAGATFGLQFGALIWGALVLGLLSISTIGSGMALGWFLGQTVELGLGGAVAGSALGGAHIKSLLWKVLALIVVLAIVTIALQSLGFAPAAKI